MEYIMSQKKRAKDVSLKKNRNIFIIKKQYVDL